MTRVLVVEDDADTRLLLRRRVATEGHGVDDVATGEAALEALRERDYDLVILDVRLPGIMGWEVIRTMAADPRLAEVPVLLCTITEPDDAPAGIESVGWLAKPFTRHDLGAALQAALAKPGS